MNIEAEFNKILQNAKLTPPSLSLPADQITKFGASNIDWVTKNRIENWRERPHEELPKYNKALVVGASLAAV